MKKILVITILSAITLIILIIIRYISRQTSIPEVSKPNKILNSSKDDLEVQAWIYPGEPSCSAFYELHKGMYADVIKIEFFKIGSQGDLELIRDQDTECNGFSEENLKLLSQYTSKIFVTVSGHQVEMSKMLADPIKKQAAISSLITMAKNKSIMGIELDFEDFSAWTSTDYLEYLQFVTSLGTQLQNINRELMVDGPAIANAEQQGWYKWKYEDLNALPISHIVVMAYDYQNDQGAGMAITPSFWLKEVINWTKTKIQDKDKIIIGLPAYAYKGKPGSFQSTVLTKNQIENSTKEQLNWRRDEESQELFTTYNGEFYALSDRQAIDFKSKIVFDMGIKRISLWHLGGNDWISN